MAKERSLERSEGSAPFSCPDDANLFRAAFDSAPIAMMVMGADLGAPGPIITHANAALSALTGYSRDELVGQSSRLFQGPRSDRAELRRRKQALVRHGHYVGTLVSYRKDRSSCSLSWSISAVLGGTGSIQGWLVSLQEEAGLGDRNRLTSELDNHRKVLFEGIPHLIWQSFDDGQWHAASPQWVDYTGQTEAASLGGGWREMIAPEDRSDTDAAWRRASETGVLAIDHRISRHDGVYRWFQTRALPVGEGGKAGQKRIWVGTSTDIEEQRAAEARIRHLAYHDVLTDVGNRGKLHDLLGRMTAGSSVDVPFNIFCIDVDDFKSINDQFGHRAGDRALQEVARRMLGCSRPSDSVARVGGDEFVLVQANALPADGAPFGERLGSKLRELFIVADQEVRLSASIGIASYPRDGRNAEILLHRADLALYSAKLDQGMRLRQFEPSMESARQERLLLQSGLARAVEQQDFRAVYQVVCCARTGVVHGYEALARWTHPELGLVSPALFVPLAEESGLITKIDHWILERACQDAASPHFAGRRMAINLSPMQFRYRTLVKAVEEALGRSNLPPNRLELEITERLLIDKNENVDRTLKDLKGLGVSIALDDFGTGYSNLEYLCRFPFDRLKIDQSFVHKLTGDRGARVVVGAIIALAHNLGLRVTAEGVETAEQLSMLRGMDCDEVQGFLLGRPLPMSALS